eukprot:gene7745-7944_t
MSAAVRAGSTRPAARSANSSPEPTHTQHDQTSPGLSGRDGCSSNTNNAKLELQKSKDNIKVAVRIRPISGKEVSRGDHVAWATDSLGGVGLLSSSSPDRVNVKYAYDMVFNQDSSNCQVFDQLGLPTIEPVLSGINGTVFAYGVTSSGKTHTMMGTEADPGLVPRCITALYNNIEQQFASSSSLCGSSA